MALILSDAAPPALARPPHFQGRLPLREFLRRNGDWLKTRNGVDDAGEREHGRKKHTRNTQEAKPAVK